MVRVVQHSWLGGQLDVEMMGRQDKDKYHIGATTLKNFLPVKRGAIRKRPGTRFIADLTTEIGGGKFRLIPFSYLSYYGFAILFVDQAAYAVNSYGEKFAVTGEIPYVEDDLDELRYVQCGDVLYLAHSRYKPACIRHTDATTFVYEEARVEPVKEGVPVITNAEMTRLRVDTDYRGGKKIEEYKVSAVRDGIETVASDAYSLDRANDEPTPTTSTGGKTATTNTTSYYLPWTESQTITLAINKNCGELADPDEIRVYKGNGSSFGLIGIVKAEGNKYVGSSQSETNKKKIFEAVSTNKLYDTSGGCDFGFDYGAWCYATASGQSETGIEIKLDHSVSYNRVEIGVGCVYANYWQASGVWNYHAWYVPAGGPKLVSARDLFVKVLHKDASNNWVSDGTVELPTVEGSGGGKVRTLLSTGGTAASKEAANAAVRRWRDELAYDKTVTVTLASAVTGVRNVRLMIVDSSGNPISTVGAGVTFSGSNVTVDGEPLVVNNVRARLENAFPGEFTDDGITPDASISPVGDEVVMSAVGDYPSTVAVYQQRLVWASSDNDPARMWMSQIGDFGVYTPHEIQTADDAIDFVLPITRFAKLNHIIEMRALLAFSEACEWVISSNSAATGVSAETIEARSHSYIGSDGRLPPIVCNNAILFAERTGESVRRYGYQLEDDGYGGRDVSIFSSSIFNEKRIVDWTYQQFPNSTIWAVLSDGTLASLLFVEDQEQKICAWATHAVGGGGRVKAVTCTHALVGNDGANDNTSEVLMIVARGEAGSETYSLEAMRPFPKQASDTVENMVTMDSVRALANGASIPEGMTAIDKVTGATVTAVGSNGAWAGYAYEAEMTSVKPAISDHDIGAGQFDVKNVQSLSLRVINTVGGRARAYGIDSAYSTLVASATPSVTDGNVATPERDIRLSLYGSNDRDGRVTLTQNEPWPIMLIMMETDLATEVEGQGQ